MNPKIRLARHLGLGLLLLTLAAPALPQQAPTLYTVEVIVFRNDGQTGALPGSTPAPAGGDDVEPMLVSGRKLGSAASRLRSAGGYRVLAHTAWEQEPTAWNSRRGVAASSLGMTSTGVQGKFIFERGQYLHFGIDLVVEDGGQRYRINEVRRVRIDEIQYFDHPAIGVIAMVSSGG